MLITYHGHSEFLVETAKGQRVLFDPYPKDVGFPMRRVKADAVAVSHHHFDHDYTQKVDGDPVIVDTEGKHTPLDGITLTGFPAFHDAEGGKQRGEILCFLLEADSLKVLHLGDLGMVPDEALKTRLFMPDILFVPVGGTYTLDAAQAAQTVKILQPRIVIPMHYKTEQGGISRITNLDPFLEQMKPSAPSYQPLLRVTREDLSQQPRLLVLSPL
jgi:L-ascorbate metabolism protein UlaG (beta-lactamase superfamily)